MPRNAVSQSGNPITYDTTGKHFRLYPTSNPKYFAVWLMQDHDNGYELYCGTWLACCNAMAENAGLLT